MSTRPESIWQAVYCICARYVPSRGPAFRAVDIAIAWDEDYDDVEQVSAATNPWYAPQSEEIVATAREMARR